MVLTNKCSIVYINKKVVITSPFKVYCDCDVSYSLHAIFTEFVNIL